MGIWLGLGGFPVILGGASLCKGVLGGQAGGQVVTYLL